MWLCIRINMYEKVGLMVVGVGGGVENKGKKIVNKKKAIGWS